MPSSIISTQLHGSTPHRRITAPGTLNFKNDNDTFSLKVDNGMLPRLAE